MVQERVGNEVTQQGGDRTIRRHIRTGQDEGNIDETETRSPTNQIEKVPHVPSVVSLHAHNIFIVVTG